MEHHWTVGLMTGTVLDGNIDVALIKTDGETVSEFGLYDLVPYSQEIRELLEQALFAENFCGIELVIDGPGTPAGIGVGENGHCPCL